MLSRDPEGRLCVEDGEGRVRLDMDDAVSHHETVNILADYVRYLERGCSQKGAWF